jgi:hypothetical protein
MRAKRSKRLENQKNHTDFLDKYIHLNDPFYFWNNIHLIQNKKFLFFSIFKSTLTPSTGF